VDRLACVSVPAFPLQLLLRRHPEWAAYPVAVVAEDRPQGLILWVSERTRRAGVLPGLRYAEGLSLMPDLRAGVVPPAEIKEGIEALTERLTRFTPEIEPASKEPGAFWLSAAGLSLLHPSLEQWARSIRSDLGAAGFRATVVVGFTRFGTYAVARARERTVVFDDPSREQAAARQIQLDRLDLNPDFRDTLSKLGVKTVDALLSLPAEGLLERFGSGAYYLYQMASDELWAPLQPCAAEEPIQQRLVLDTAETDVTRLLFLIKRLLHPLLAMLVVRGEALAELILRLLLDRSGWREERVRPAVPTLDAIQVLDLVRLRLETMGLSAGVIEVELTVQGSPATREQLRLVAGPPQRDLDAANRALARLRAEFGDQAVVLAKLTDRHLPEASFAWEPLERLVLPRPREGALRSLVRRILTKPTPLPLRQLPSKLLGPYIVSGGWWAEEAHREYYFGEAPGGDLLWLYYDNRRGEWFLHGRVE